MSAPALGARPALPVPREWPIPFAFWLHLKPVFNFFLFLVAALGEGSSAVLHLGVAEPWGALSAQHPVSWGSPALGVRCPTGLALSLRFPCGARCPPLTLGRAKLCARDAHVDAEAVLFLSPGGCAAPTVPRGKPMPGATPKPAGGQALPRATCPSFSLGAGAHVAPALGWLAVAGRAGSYHARLRRVTLPG